MLVRVVAPHFVAGLVLDDAGVCVYAAPILGWCVGKDREWLRLEFQRRRYVASVLRD